MTEQTKALQAMTPEQFERALVKSHATPEDATWALAEAQKRFHLVTPATSVGALPAGCAVVPTLVRVDVDGDTYETEGGLRGLSKTALNQIAAGLGISWDPTLSRRLDDASDPHYAHYRAVGHYRAFDGQVQTIMGDREVDARTGSPQIAGMKAGQIKGLRQHVLSHAQTKAQLRAVRSLGVRTGYSRADLAKPFCCARIMFTGQTDDPKLREKFALMTAESFIGGREKLFGAGASQARDVDEPVPPHAPPAIEAPEDVPPPSRVRTTQPHPNSPPLPENEDNGRMGPPGGWDDAPPRDVPNRPAQSTPTSSLVIPWGKTKGTPIGEAETSDLQYVGNSIAESLEADPDGKWATKNRTLLAGIRHELQTRGED